MIVAIIGAQVCKGNFARYVKGIKTDAGRRFPGSSSKFRAAKSICGTDALSPSRSTLTDQGYAA